MADEVVDVGGSAVPRKQAGKASDIFSSLYWIFLLWVFVVGMDGEGEDDFGGYRGTSYLFLPGLWLLGWEGVVRGREGRESYI